MFLQHLSLFQRGIKATLSVDKTYSMMINRTLNIAYGLMLLILMGFNALPLVLALTCLLVVLAFFLGPACRYVLSQDLCGIFEFLIFALAGTWKASFLSYGAGCSTSVTESTLSATPIRQLL